VKLYRREVPYRKPFVLFSIRFPCGRAQECFHGVRADDNRGIARAFTNPFNLQTSPTELAVEILVYETRYSSATPAAAGGRAGATVCIVRRLWRTRNGLLPAFEIPLTCALHVADVCFVFFFSRNFYPRDCRN